MMTGISELSFCSSPGSVIEPTQLPMCVGFVGQSYQCWLTIGIFSVDFWECFFSSGCLVFSLHIVMACRVWKWMLTVYRWSCSVVRWLVTQVKRGQLRCAVGLVHITLDGVAPYTYWRFCTPWFSMQYVDAVGLAQVQVLCHYNKIWPLGFPYSVSLAL